ncbi:MAG: hypothetical protein IPJ41_15940 [Phycisphaerales bacterium]|nr:hypothetical protein [Phycisphaerales bacterium]
MVARLGVGRIGLAICVATAGLGGLLLAGCNIVGPAFLLASGPEKIPQVYKLDEKRPTVIFFDDRAGIIRRAPTRTRITTAAEKALLKAKVVDRLLDSRAASALVANEPRGELMPISEVGRSVGAEVVIYVVPEVYTLSTDGQSYAPTATLRVKILDAVADKRLWPEEREGYALIVKEDTRQGTAPKDASAMREAEDRFADLVGLRLGQMFYSREPDTAADKRELGGASQD